MTEHAEPAVIEILEVADDYSRSRGLIIPNEIRINGHPVLAPADDPVIVHETSISTNDVVKVTLTLFARRVIIGHADGGDAA